MKSIFAVLALAAAALAQTVDISFPLAGQNIPAGSSINVQVEEGVREPPVSTTFNFS